MHLGTLVCPRGCASATHTEKKQVQPDGFATTLRKSQEIRELPLPVFQPTPTSVKLQGGSVTVTPVSLGDVLQAELQGPGKTLPSPPLRRWKHDGSDHTWRILKSSCVAQHSMLCCFFLWCPILCAVGCVTQKPFLASHSFQLHEEVFCMLIW